MTITKAIQHFIFKFQKSWKATKADNDALNTIIDFVNEKHKYQYMNNELFAKLYIYAYATFIDKHKASVFDPFAQKELHKFLDQPMEKIVQRFTNKLNTNASNERLKDFRYKVTPEGRKYNRELKKDLFDDVWTFEEVAKNLETQINLAINEYGTR